MQKNERSATHRKRRSWRMWLLIMATLTTLSATAFMILLSWHQRLPAVGVQNLASLQSRIERAKSAALSGRHETFRFNTDEVNSILRARFRGSANTDSGKASIQDVRIKFVNDEVKSYIVLASHLESVTIELDGRLHSHSGILEFEPLAGKIGSLPIPQAALTQAVREITTNSKATDLFRLHGNVSDLKVEDSQLVIAYN